MQTTNLNKTNDIANGESSYLLRKDVIEEFSSSKLPFTYQSGHNLFIETTHTTGVDNKQQLHQHPTNIDNSKSKINFHDAMPQIGASFIIYMLVVQAGANMAYSAILIPQLTNSHSTIPITKVEASWIASLLAISSPIGASFVGILMDRFGRKMCAIVTVIPFIISWILISTATNIYVLYVARILGGVGSGISMIGTVYVGEISHPSLRPVLLALNSVFVSVGVLLTCIFGLIFDWRIIAFALTTTTGVTFFMQLLIPESPQWYITFRPDDIGKLEKSLRWLYRRKDLYDRQYIQIQQQGIQLKHVEGTDVSLIITTEKQPVAPWYHLFKKSTVHKPFKILLILFALQQLSGGYIIIYYAVNIFLKIGANFSTNFNEYGAMMLLGLIRLIMSIVSALVSGKFSRRLLMITSSLGMGMVALMAGLYVFFTQMETDPNSSMDNFISDSTNKRENNYFLVICILAHVLFGGLGVLVIPWSLLTELLPTEARGKIGGIIMSYVYLLTFITVKIFPFAMDWIGIQRIFYIFAVTSFSTVFYVYGFLPETLGKTFDEISQYFK